MPQPANPTRKPSTPTVLAMLATACLPAAAAGQNTAVVPVLNSVVEGNRAANYAIPLGGNARFQQVWSASAIAVNSATLTSLAFRRDVQGNDPLPTWSFFDIEVSLSHTTAAPGGLSPDFTVNVTSTPTVVYSGPLTLPAVPTATASPAIDFAIEIPFQVPFSFVVGQGNLLLDISWGQAQIAQPGGFASIPLYPVDAEAWGTRGALTGFGSAGTLSDGQTTSIWVEQPAGPAGASLVPGGQFAIEVSSGTLNSYFCSVLFGLSNTSSPTGSLPLPLAGVGAPGNQLLVSPDINVAFAPSFFTGIPALGFGGYEASFPLTMPTTVNLLLPTFYAQGVILDPAANSLGIVASNAIAVTLGANAGTPETDAISSLPGLPIVGLPAINGAVGGPVVEFTGTFQ